MAELDLDELRRMHIKRKPFDDCSLCDSDWPCLPAELLELLAEKEARLSSLRERGDWLDGQVTVIASERAEARAERVAALAEVTALGQACIPLGGCVGVSQQQLLAENAELKATLVKIEALAERGYCCDECESWVDGIRAALKADRCECPPCPGRGNDGHCLTHCAECCFGSGVIADIDCPQHGEKANR